MNGRDIPGYYFDVEKNKYFRILPGHVAPEGSRYTHAQIEATEAQQKRDREQLIRDNQLRTQRVRRARALDTSCYVSPTLVRETDVPSRSSRAFRFRTFASGLHRVRLIRSEVKEITALARVDTPGSLFGVLPPTVRFRRPNGLVQNHFQDSHCSEHFSTSRYAIAR